MCSSQKEDGIRDLGVTGVQTCALPILAALRYPSRAAASVTIRPGGGSCAFCCDVVMSAASTGRRARITCIAGRRSEERRVGQECRFRWSRSYSQKNQFTLPFCTTCPLL